MDKLKIAGVVLAGGRSSRMGKSKAMLEYKGVPLLDWMVGVLSDSGLKKTYISGVFEGYSCIPDSTPHEGPARAICNVLSTLKSYESVLFVPVDMPFLTADILNILLQQKEGGYFKNHPLPVLVKKNNIQTEANSIHGLLKEFSIPSVFLPLEFEKNMKNINTKEEWQKVSRA